VTAKVAAWARALAVSAPAQAKALHADPFVRFLKAVGAALACVAFLLCPTFADGAGPTPQPPSPEWKAEIGTADMEKALDLTPADEAEIQMRLKALGLYQGTLTGTLDEQTRFAISAWQKDHGLALSAYLGPLQLAELRVESEDAYLRLLGAQAAPNPAPAQAGPKPAPAAARPEPGRPFRPAPRAASAAHVAREPARESIRRVARRSVAAPAAPATAPGCNANPEWCAKAGLPASGAAPRPGRPPQFTGGF